MEPTRFDEFTKVLATPTTRRQALKAIAATTIGGILGLRGIGTTFAKNMTCAQWCAAVFGANTPAAEQCSADAAHHTGLCYSGGPTSSGGGVAPSSICCTRNSSGYCSSYSSATCCSNGYTCVNGACCANSLVCGTGASAVCCGNCQTCSNGTCASTCAGCNATCTSGTCSCGTGTTGTTATPTAGGTTTCVKKCSQNSDCQGGSCLASPDGHSYCSDEFAYTGSGTCTSPTDCPVGSFCADTFCVRATC